MLEKPGAFDQALSNFTFGVANRDLICHMAAEGYSVRQIKEATDYPVSVEKIAETVWEYYIETGVIRLAPPWVGDEPRYEYVMDIGKYGKRSFRRVEMATNEDGDTSKHSYIACNFGILRDKEPVIYEKTLAALDSRKRDYVSGLPWPTQIVYHIDNLTMREIRDILQEKGLWDS